MPAGSWRNPSFTAEGFRAYDMQVHAQRACEDTELITRSPAASISLCSQATLPASYL